MLAAETEAAGSLCCRSYEWVLTVEIKKEADDGSRRPGPSDLDGMTGEIARRAARQVGKSPRRKNVRRVMEAVKTHRRIGARHAACAVVERA
jgi:hypothetical protein